VVIDQVIPRKARGSLWLKRETPQSRSACRYWVKNLKKSPFLLSHYERYLQSEHRTFGGAVRAEA